MRRIKNNSTTQHKEDNNPYNSMDLDEDVIYDYLARGLRTPQDETEKRWAEEGKKILASGKGYDISFD